MEHTVPSKGFTNHFLLGRLTEHLTAHEAEKREKVRKCFVKVAYTAILLLDGVWTVVPTFADNV